MTDAKSPRTAEQKRSECLLQIDVISEPPHVCILLLIIGLKATTTTAATAVFYIPAGINKLFRYDCCKYCGCTSNTSGYDRRGQFKILVYSNNYSSVEMGHIQMSRRYDMYSSTTLLYEIAQTHRTPCLSYYPSVCFPHRPHKYLNEA